MILSLYILAVTLFTLTFFYLKLNNNFYLVLNTSRCALTTLNNKQLADIEKETEIQKAALNLFKQAAIILLKSAVIITITMIPFWLADTFEIASWEETTTFSLRADVLIYTIVTMSASVFIYKAIKAKSTT